MANIQTDPDAGRSHHVIGLVANSAERMPCLLHRHRQIPWLQPGDAITQYCVGRYSAGEIMLRTMPRRSPEASSAEALLAGHPSPWLVAHACSGGAAGQLYRFRRWLMAVGNTVVLPPQVRSELLEALPPFVRRLRASSCDPELLFLRMIAALHDDALLGATSRYGELADRLRRTTRAAAQPVDVIACNGQAMFGAGPSLVYCLLDGLDTCELCGISDTSAWRAPGCRSHREFKAVCVATQRLAFSERWHEVHSGQVLVVDSSLRVHCFDESEADAALSNR